MQANHRQRTSSAPGTHALQAVADEACTPSTPDRTQLQQQNSFQMAAKQGSFGNRQLPASAHGFAQSSHRQASWSSLDDGIGNHNNCSIGRKLPYGGSWRLPVPAARTSPPDRADSSGHEMQQLPSHIHCNDIAGQDTSYGQVPSVLSPLPIQQAQQLINNENEQEFPQQNLIGSNCRQQLPSRSRAQGSTACTDVLPDGMGAAARPHIHPGSHQRRSPHLSGLQAQIDQGAMPHNSQHPSILGDHVATHLNMNRPQPNVAQQQMEQQKKEARGSPFGLLNSIANDRRQQSPFIGVGDMQNCSGLATSVHARGQQARGRAWSRCSSAPGLPGGTSLQASPLPPANTSFCWQQGYLPDIHQPLQLSSARLKAHAHRGGSGAKGCLAW